VAGLPPPPCFLQYDAEGIEKEEDEQENRTVRAVPPVAAGFPLAAAHESGAMRCSIVKERWAGARLFTRREGASHSGTARGHINN